MAGTLPRRDPNRVAVAPAVFGYAQDDRRGWVRVFIVSRGCGRFVNRPYGLVQILKCVRQFNIASLREGGAECIRGGRSTRKVKRLLLLHLLVPLFRLLLPSFSCENATSLAEGGLGWRNF